MNYRVGCFVLMLFPMIAWSDTTPNRQVEVKQTIRPGTRYVSTNLKYVKVLTVNAEPTETIYVMHQRIVFKQVTAKPDVDGFTTVSLSPVQIQLRQFSRDKPGHMLNYDSKTAPAESPLARIFQPLLKSRYVLTFDGKGEFRAMVIRGNPWTKMARSCGKSEEWIAEYCAEIFGVSHITELVNLPTRYLKQKVKQGDAWDMPDRDMAYFGRTSHRGPLDARVTVSSVTDEQVVFSVSERRPNRILTLSMDRQHLTFSGFGPPDPSVPPRQVGKVVFDRKTNTSTKALLEIATGINRVNSDKTITEKHRQRLQIGRTVSETPISLKPLPPVLTAIKKLAPKTPTTKPAGTPPAAEKKTTPAKAKNATTS